MRWLQNEQNLVPALIESIKVAGLVLVIDTSEEKNPSSSSRVTTTTTTATATATAAATATATAPGSKAPSSAAVAAAAAQPSQSLYRMPDGVDGILKGNGVLRFHDTIDM